MLLPNTPFCLLPFGFKSNFHALKALLNSAHLQLLWGQQSHQLVQQAGGCLKQMWQRIVHGSLQCLRCICWNTVPDLSQHDCQQLSTEISSSAASLSQARQAIAGSCKVHLIDKSHIQASSCKNKASRASILQHGTQVTLMQRIDELCLPWELPDAGS